MVTKQTSHLNAFLSINIMEVWKDVYWFKNYKVSNLWNIKSFKYWEEKILKPYKDKKWYLIIDLYNKSRKVFKVHRLVMITFEWEKKLQVNHKNWIKSDNRLKNLEWNTQQENIKHRYKVLWQQWSHKWKYWKNHPSSKKINQYDLKWNFIKTWGSLTEAANNYLTTKSNISLCCRKKNKTAVWFIWKYK